MNSIRRQLIFGLLAGLTVISVVCGSALYGFVRRALTRQFDESLRGKAATFAALSNQSEEDERGTRVPIEDLSMAVRNTIQQQAQGALVTEVEEVTRQDRPFYKVEAVRNGLEFEFLVGAAGQYLGLNDEFGFAFEQAALPEFQPSPSSEYYEVWGEDGEVIAKSPSLEAASLVRPRATQDAPRSFDMVLPDGRPGRGLALRFFPRQSVHDEEAGRPAGQSAPGEHVLLVMARSRAGLDRALGILLSGLGLSGFLLLIGAALMVSWSVKKGLRPLHMVAQQATDIDVERLGYRFPTRELPFELLPISTRLNELLDRLEAAFVREKRFTSDVAHELRTPIAELQSLAEVGLRSDPSQLRDEELFQYLEDTLAIATQMERLVSALLTIARSEAGQQAVERGRVEIIALLKKAWRPFEAAAHEHELTVDFDLPDQLSIETDSTMLTAMLTNLFSNAVSYTPHGGEIVVALSIDGPSPQLSITNTNDQIEQTDLAHMFEPFWRKDRARSDSAHSGLGLAVAGAFARLLGMDVSVDLPSSTLFRLAMQCPRSRSRS